MASAGVSLCSSSRVLQPAGCGSTFLLVQGTTKFWWPQRVGLTCSNLSSSSRKLRSKRRIRSGSWNCFSYNVALSQVTEAEGSKLRGGRKGKIGDVDDSVIRNSPSNGLAHSDFGSEGKTQTEDSVLRKGKPKSSWRTAEQSNGVGGSTSARRRGRKKIVRDGGGGDRVEDVESTHQHEEFSSEESGSDLEADHRSSRTAWNEEDFYDSSLESEKEPEAEVEESRKDSQDSIAQGGRSQTSDSFARPSSVSVGEEKDLRLMFLESIMRRARSGDVDGVEEALAELEIAGIKAGPRSYHGLVVAYTLARDSEGAVQALRRVVAAGEKPLPETFVTMARLFGSLGEAERGTEILGAMEKLNLDPRIAWLVLVEELHKAGRLADANEIFLKGADGGMKGTIPLYDLLIEENAKIGDHGNAINIMRALEYAGFQPTTFHYNCLLMCQANANVPDVAASTFEEMQYGEDIMKPDTESYNWLFQSHIRHNYGDRCQEVVDLLGEMVEDYKRVQPNMRTYALLVECFTKYNVVSEAVRHFRALSRLSGGVTYLHDKGRNGDPLSIYLRAVCLEGRSLDLLEALEVMVKEKQPIPSRAMIINKKGRTLVSSWIEPIGTEVDVGYDIDYIARYVAEGGASGTRKRWSESGARAEDCEGFAFSAPMETSFKQHCIQMRRRYTLKLIRKLRAEGVHALGPGATDADVVRIMAKLRKETIGELVFQPKKPKAASKMLVSELKEELDAQGLPTDGTRPVLYQRVQKARRINRARGRPLWVPPSENEVEEQVEEDTHDIFMERLNLKDDNTEFWRKRLTGEDESSELLQSSSATSDFIEETDLEDGEDEEDDDDEEVEEENEEVEDLVDDGGEEEEVEAPELLALQLLKKKADLAAEEKVPDEQEPKEAEWLGLSFEQKIAKLRSENYLDPAELYTIADVWGWTWEKDIRSKEPERWSQELEVQLGMQIMQRVLNLGGTPTIADCAMLIRAAMRIPWPEAIVSIIQETHKLNIVLGSKLYNEAVQLCITLGEKDAAIAIITNMEEVGVEAPSDLINTVLLGSSQELDSLQQIS
ncbi:hypothetical protein R1flu_009805 [Riccia fluitans]|uniref:SAP domain-containing protein n=1 Tax=Riccia fluitans TaxID=41844 RepID=A0ABD1Z3A7_9MARC